MREIYLLLPLLIVVIGSTTVLSAVENAPNMATPAAGEQITWQVISGGGNRSTSASYIVMATIGQTAAGPVASSSYRVNQGFWQNFAAVTSCCSGTTGNVNESVSESPDLSDLSLLIAYLTVTPRPTLPCLPEANINTAGIIDLSDLSLLIAYLTMMPRPTLPNCP